MPVNANSGLKQLSWGILDYFGHIQNYLKIEGNFV